MGSGSDSFPFVSVVERWKGVRVSTSPNDSSLSILSLEKLETYFRIRMGLHWIRPLTGVSCVVFETLDLLNTVLYSVTKVQPETHRHVFTASSLIVKISEIFYFDSQLGTGILVSRFLRVVLHLCIFPILWIWDWFTPSKILRFDQVMSF